MSMFFIGFTGRQGSSYLEGLLNSHPDAQCLGEIFADPAITDHRGFLRKTVQASGVIASGFKLAASHMDLHPGLLPLLRQGGYKGILLTRENKLEQYVSFLLAGANGSWRSDQGEYTIQTVRIYTPDLVGVLAGFQAGDVTLGERLRGFETMPLAYEDLIAEGGSLPALDFLGLRHMKLESPFKRQRTKSQRDTIENYDEVRAALSGTPFANCLVDEPDLVARAERARSPSPVPL